MDLKLLEQDLKRGWSVDNLAICFDIPYLELKGIILENACFGIPEDEIFWRRSQIPKETRKGVLKLQKEVVDRLLDYNPGYIFTDL